MKRIFGTLLALVALFTTAAFAFPQEVSAAGPDDEAHEPFVYTVKCGDTLWGIAERFLGSGFRYPELATLNHIENPRLIFCGQRIVIPSLVSLAHHQKVHEELEQAKAEIAELRENEEHLTATISKLEENVGQLTTANAQLQENAQAMNQVITVLSDMLDKERERSLMLENDLSVRQREVAWMILGIVIGLGVLGGMAYSWITLYRERKYLKHSLKEAQDKNKLLQDVQGQYGNLFKEYGDLHSQNQRLEDALRDPEKLVQRMSPESLVALGNQPVKCQEPGCLETVLARNLERHLKRHAK